MLYFSPPLLALLPRLFFVAFIFLVSLLQRAEAKRRLPGVIFRVDQSQADITTKPHEHSSNIIFLNKCEGGCTVLPGRDDSRKNTSSIVAGTLGAPAYISEFEHSDEDWQNLVSCVKRVYEPFGIIVTDEDPGNDPHFEAIVAGIDDEIAFVAGGVAPGGCGVTNNAITFSFANQGSLDSLCWTVAQETAHAFGLDHEMLCSDPMTYLTTCSTNKTFQNEDAPCGEYTERECLCSGQNTQNSYQLILDHFGSGTLTPPEVAFIRPKDGATVRSHFPIEVRARDNVEVRRVEVFVNGQLVAELKQRPFVVNAPSVLSAKVEVEVRAYDNLDTMSEAVTLTVEIDDTELDFGESCTENRLCGSQLCVFDSEDRGRCSALCDLEAAQNSCPEGTTCIASSDQAVCWKSGSQPDSYGLCGAGGSSSLLSAFGILFCLGYWRRRKVGQWA